MIVRTIMVENEQGSPIENGRVKWDPSTGIWGFDTNDSEIADLMREVGNSGKIGLRTFSREGDAIFDGIRDIDTKDEKFLSALEDHLVRKSRLFMMFGDVVET